MKLEILIISAAVMVAIIFLLVRIGSAKELTGTEGILAEADIYISYGQIEQAIELLENAIDSDPENTALKNKLRSL